MSRISKKAVLIAGAVTGLSLAGVGYALFTGGGAVSGAFNQVVGTALLDPPTNVTVPSLTPSPVHVTWTATSAPAPVGGNVDGYYVQRYLGGTPSDACGSSPSSLLPGNSTSCDDTVVVAGTYTYKVTAYWRTWTAQSTASGSVDVTAVGAPNPTSGNVGSSVTITGGRFLPNTALTVTVGGTSATITAGSSSDGSGDVAITFTVPAKVAGSYDVVVSDGTRTATSATQFTITRSITLVPTHGNVGNTVTMAGDAFPASSSVTATFDGGAVTLAPATSTNGSGSFSGATFTVPASTWGAKTVQATAGGQSASATFTVTAISLSSTTGATGTTVTLSGGGYGASKTLSATYDGAALTLSPASPTTDGSGNVPGSVTFTVPASVAGAHTVVVTDDSVPARSASATYTVIAAITLTANTGNAGSSVTISGTGFGASKSLSATWDGAALTLSPASPTTSSVGSVPGSVTFVVPGSTSGAHTVVVTDNAGSPNSANATFTTTFPACTSGGASVHYVSVATGNWGSTSTWYSCSNGSAWAAATATPTNTSGPVIVQAANVVTIAASVTIDQTTVASGGNLQISAGQTATLNNGSSTDLTVTGSLGVSGSIVSNNNVAVAAAGSVSIANGGSISGFGSGAPFTLNSGGSLAIAAGGSFTGGGQNSQFIVNSGATATNDGTLSSFGQITINGSFTSSTNVTWTSVTNMQVGGTLTMTGGTLTVARGNGGTMGQINSGGSIILQNSSVFALAGVASSTYTVASGGTLEMDPSALVNSTGFLTVAAGGNLKIGSVDGITTGTTNGNVRTSGNADSYSTTANYNYDGTAAQTAGNAFAGANNLTVGNTSGVGFSTTAPISGTMTATGSVDINSGATFTLTGSTTSTVDSTYTLTVKSGATFGVGASAILGGAGAFTLDSGGTLQVASTAGITTSGSTGNIQVSGSRSYHTGASYTYNGTSAQNTGNGLPATANALTVNNAAGVTLDASITLTNGGTVTSGTFTIGANTVTNSGSSVLIMGTNTLSRTSGYVIGSLRRTIPTGASVSRTFDVGISGDYLPVTLVFANVTVSGTFTVTGVSGAEPNFGSWTPGGAKKVNAYWTFAQSGITLSGPNTFTAKFQWNSGLEDASYVVASSKVGRYSAGWTYPTIGAGPNAGPPRDITASGLTIATGTGSFQVAN